MIRSVIVNKRAGNRVGLAGPGRASGRSRSSLASVYRIRIEPSRVLGNHAMASKVFLERSESLPTCMGKRGADEIPFGRSEKREIPARGRRPTSRCWSMPHA